MNPEQAVTEILKLDSIDEGSIDNFVLITMLVYSRLLKRHYIFNNKKLLICVKTC